jgi:hypothetical protein
MRHAAAVSAGLVAAALGGALLGSEFNHRPFSPRSRQQSTRATQSVRASAVVSIERAWRSAAAASPVAMPHQLPTTRGLLAGCGISWSRWVVVDHGRGLELHARADRLDYLKALARLYGPQPMPLLVEVRDSDRRLLFVATHLRGRPIRAWVSPRLLGVTK